MITAIVETAKLTLSLQLRSRLFQILLVLAAGLPWLLSLVPDGDVRGNALFETVCGMAVFTLLLPFVCLYLCVHAVHSDLEDRTSTYLFTRPVSRASLLVGKLLAVVVCGWIFAAVAIGTVFVAVRYTGVEWRDGMMPSADSLAGMLLGAVVMVVGYTGYGALIAAFFRRPLLIAVVLCVIEVFASRLPPQVGIHDLTVNSPVRRLLVDLIDEPSRGFRLMMVQHMGDGPRRRRGRRKPKPEPVVVAVPQTPALLALLKVWGVSLGLGMWIYTRREYDSRPRE